MRESEVPFRLLVLAGAHTPKRSVINRMNCARGRKVPISEKIRVARPLLSNRVTEIYLSIAMCKRFQISLSLAAADAGLRAQTLPTSKETGSDASVLVLLAALIHEGGSVGIAFSVV